MNIELRKLRHVVTLAGTGNMSRAAEDLHITQPALSRSIASVEAEVGSRLFDRGRNGVAMTAIGRLFVAEAESLLRNAQNLQDKMGRYERGEAGSASIGMVPQLASLILPTVATETMGARPGLEFYSSIKAPEELNRELSESRIDLFFCYREQAPRGLNLTIESLCWLAGAVFVRADHPLTQRENLQAEDLVEFPMLGGVKVPKSARVSEDQGVFTCSNFHILRELALSSDGILGASIEFVRQELAQGALVRLEIPLHVPVNNLEVVMVTNQDSELLPATQDIVTRIRDYLLTLASQPD